MSSMPRWALINTGALARCEDALGTHELFQQFDAERDLKRLTQHLDPTHRAKAPVLMRFRLRVCELFEL